MSGMFEEEPEVLDESDPRVEDELHKTMEFMGMQPGDLPDQGDAARYRDWFDKQMSDSRSPVQEQQLDFLLEEEFTCNPRFLNFFVRAASSAKSEGVPPIPAPHENWSCKAIRSVTTSAGESDVLVVYRSVDPQKPNIAILIEDKIRAGFQKEQAERYRKRGEAGVGKTWDGFWSCLVSPKKYTSNPADFDAKITLESIQAFFEQGDDARSRFKAGVIDSALSHFASKGVHNVDPVMTTFRSYYAERAAATFEGTGLSWDLPRDAWYDDSWFYFRTEELPRGVVIVHKTKPGLVHMAFRGMTKEMLERGLNESRRTEGFRVAQTGKSASIEVSVPAIDSFHDPSASDGALSSAFAAVNALMSFWRENKQHFNAENPPAKDSAEEHTEEAQKLRALQEMLHGLVRARALEYNAAPPIQGPDLSSLSRTESKLWFPVPGMAGGFDIRLVIGKDGEPTVYADSDSRIWDGGMRHIVTIFNVKSAPYNYMGDPSLDEWVVEQTCATSHPDQI